MIFFFAGHGRSAKHWNKKFKYTLLAEGNGREYFACLYYLQGDPIQDERLYLYV